MNGFVRARPLLFAWLLLAVVMVALMLWSSAGAGLAAGQTAALVVATVLLAGACVRIVTWE